MINEKKLKAKALVGCDILRSILAADNRNDGHEVEDFVEKYHTDLVALVRFAEQALGRTGSGKR